MHLMMYLVWRALILQKILSCSILVISVLVEQASVNLLCLTLLQNWDQRIIIMKIGVTIIHMYLVIALI